MARMIDRLDEYMRTHGLNDNMVTVEAGLSVGVIGKSRAAGRDLSRKSAEKILAVYPQMSRSWLLAGEGTPDTQDDTLEAAIKELAKAVRELNETLKNKTP